MKPSPLEADYAALLEKNHARWAGIARAYAAGGEREDLLQEIMLQVWRAWRTFGGRSERDTWAYRVALNTALAWDRSARNRRRLVPTETRDITQLKADPSSEHQEAKLLDEFLQSLSQVDRAVLLTYLDGVPTGEAAEITGMSEGALRVRLHRLKKRFQETYCPAEGAP